MLDIKQFLVFFKTELQKINSNVFYVEIDKNYRDIYPVIVFNTEYNIVNQQRINFVIDINVYVNKFNDILTLEQITQDIYNYFNFYRTYTNKNGVDFSILVKDIKAVGAPTDEENLKRKIITIELETQFK